MTLSPQEIQQFQDIIWGYGRDYFRRMPWRETPSPFNVVISEMMLQQTQVQRVIPKFNAFLYTCDNFADLAKLPLSKVLSLWSGLGYNRRAKYLHQLATIVVRDHHSQLPTDIRQLVRLPGIGPNTAGAIMAYAFNQPSIFIETNIRTVLFHHFFTDDDRSVDDAELRVLMTQLIDHEHPREWYWALMDYGAYLKQTAGGRLTTSKHYKKQTPLTGSLREMRGRIIRQLITGPVSDQQLQKSVQADQRYSPAKQALIREGLIAERSGRIYLTEATEVS